MRRCAVRRKGSGKEEVGEGFSILLWYFSVCRFFLSFLFFLFAPLSLRGWRHGYQGSLGTDNMAQTMASSPRWWSGGESERLREREREREAGTGPQGKTRAEWCISLQSTDTLLNYSTLSLSLDTHSLSFLKQTLTHHFNLTLLNEVQRHLNWKWRCSLKLETSFYHQPQEFLTSITIRLYLCDYKIKVNNRLNKYK